MPRFSLITLDLDDTLWPCRSVIRRAEVALYAWLGDVAKRVIAAHDVESLGEHRRQVMQERPDIAHDLTAVRTLSLRQLLQEFGYDPDLAVVGCRLFLRHRSVVEPYADVIPVLSRLADQYSLVSVTNGNARVERTPLRGIFDISINAAEVGAAKPDPRMLIAAMERTGSRSEQSVHVGDDPYRDVEAARQVGMGTVWVNRNGREWPAELPSPDASVEDLHQLRHWLDGST